MKTKLFYLIFSTLLCAFVLHAQKTTFPQVEIAGTQLRTISSSIVGQEYNLYINLPRDYTDTTKNFPVIFLLDAQWDFTLATSLYGQLHYDGFVPGHIIVGITWGGKNARADSLRVRDFSPTHVSTIVQTGGAEKFLSFIEKELIPFVNGNYRVTESGRTLMGSSYGGLFTLYALFSGKNVFDKYILTSPYLTFDNSVINSFVEKFMKENKPLPAKLFLAYGEMEYGGDAFNKFVENLKFKKFQELQIYSEILKGMGHSSGKAEGYARGLQFVSERASLKLSDKILNQYIGIYQYQNAPEQNVTVSKKDGHLLVTMANNSTLEVFAETENSFYAKILYCFITFGKTDEVKVEQYGGTSILKKIN